ncbi:MAG: sulfurtransferase [Cellulomonadaceae bacterium]|jgi:thiosulfate/3-mercaptopyruvate sulfurtransferase|nr:sulfurtransferase [Cellulomonadaceae bacterium]
MSDTTRAAVLVTSKQLAAEIADTQEDLVILDVRWELPTGTGEKVDGHADYLAGHIPGAVYVDLDAQLAAPPAPGEGRHPLPPIDDLEVAARSWGIHKDSRVVVYDDISGQGAARAWWLLRYGGLTDVRILDGGFEEWEISGHPVDSDEVTVMPGDVTLTPGHMPVLTADQALEWAARGDLLDARGGVRYRGEFEPIDVKAGHIPGARSAPTGHNLTRDGLFRPAEDLTVRFAAHDVRPGEPVGVYCGSGVTAAHQIAALASIGIEAALYVPSWSGWVGDDNHPVETGPDPWRQAAAA